VFFIGKRYSRGRGRQFDFNVLFQARLLKAALDFSNVLKIFTQRCAVLRSQTTLQFRRLAGERVENAPVFLISGNSVGSGATLAKHSFEDPAGMISIGNGVVGVRHDNVFM
jgi:hypothetical protein